jgi:Kae1-associated kinase Bud32
MTAEARMLHRLTFAGLPVPHVLALDMGSGWMVQERRPGRPLIECLRDPAAAASIPEMLAAAGTAIRNLHAQGAAHGDLTTNNLLWDEASGISLIDFGLARWNTEVERFGLDLQVLHECLSASHPEHADAMEQVLSGYSTAEAAGVVDHAAEQLASAAEVLTRFEQIRTRVRYHG